MTIIVKHKRTGNQYILLPIQGEGNQGNPSRFLSELFTQEKSELSFSVTVCDVRGNIFFADLNDLIVTEIDGKKPADILPQSSFETVAQEVTEGFADDFEDDFEDEFAEEEKQIKYNQPETSSVNSASSFTAQDSEDDADWI